MGHVTTTEINYEECTQIFCLVYSQIIYLWFSYENKSTGFLSHPVSYYYHNVPLYSHQTQYSPLNLSAGHNVLIYVSDCDLIQLCLFILTHL